MSAVLTTLASILIYVVVARQLASIRTVHRALAGLAAGISFGLSPLVWSQAVITEVYALQAFLLVAIIFLYTMRAMGKSLNRGALDGGRGLALGLALGNHVTALLLVPLALLTGSIQPNPNEEPPAGERRWLHRTRLSLPPLVMQLLGLALGLSLYLILPVRASTHPPVNWGNPDFGSRLWWLVSGKLYQSYYLQPDFLHLLPQARAWAQFSLVQLGLLGIFLGLAGLVVFGKFSPLFILTAGVAIAALVFSLVYHPPEAEVYLMPLLVSFSIWLGIGVGGLAGLLSKRTPALATVASLLILGLLLFRSLSYFQQVDASQDSRAEAFAREVLSSAPQDAILFASGDRAIFALWYFHFAMHERPDLVVLARELVPYDWYRESLEHTYPALVLPDPILFPETIVRYNSHRPICNVRYVDRTELECEAE